MTLSVTTIYLSAFIGNKFLFDEHPDIKTNKTTGIAIILVTKFRFNV